MKKPIQVVMLPTEVDEQLRSSIYKHSENDIISLGFLNSRSTKNIPQHLYITVSQDVEPIKEGDWFYLSNKGVFQCYTNSGTGIWFSREGKEGYEASPKYCRKVIATTDPKLTELSSCEGTGYDGRKRCMDCDGAGTIKIPQLQQSFLKEYVANPNREWVVEYEIYDDPNFVVDLNIEMRLTPRILNRIKLNQDNTVNINLVEEKMYSRDKFIESLHSYWDKMHGKGYQNISMINWIKENL